MHLLALVLILSPCWASSPSALRAGPPPRTISLLGLFELTTNTGAARVDGRSELEAARMAVRHINQRASLLPGFKLQLLTNDTKVIKVNDQVVLQRIQHLPDANALGQDRAALLSEFAASLNKDLRANGSTAALKTMEKSKHPRSKMPHLNPEDIARNLDSIEAHLQNLRSTKYASLNEKYNVEGVSKKLSSQVAKLKELTSSLNQNSSSGKQLKMTGVVRKKGFMTDEKPQRDFNAAAQDKVKPMYEFAGDLSRDTASSKAKSRRPEIPQPGGSKQRQITTADIAKNMDLIDAEYKELRSRRQTMLNEKHNVEVLGKKLRSEVTRFKALNESLHNELTVSKEHKKLLEDSKSQLCDTTNILHLEIKEIREKVKQQQKQLIDLKKAEEKLDERLHSKNLLDVRAKIEKYQSEMKTAVDGAVETKKKLADLNENLAGVEKELKVQTEARDELQERLKTCMAENETLRHQLKKECEEIETLTQAAVETRKSLGLSKVQNQELELELLDVSNKCQEAAAKKEKVKDELKNLSKEIVEAESEFSIKESLVRETKTGIKMMETAIVEKKKKKNEQVKLMETLETETALLEKKCDPGVGVDAFFHALYTRPSTKLPMLLGSACSEVTESLAKVTPYWNIVQVAFGSTSPSLSDRREFPLFYRTVAPDSSHNPARLAFVRGFGWDTVTALSQDEDVFSLAVNDLVTELEEANITCRATITFSELDFKDQLLHLRDLDTRIIIGSFSHKVAPKIFCEAYHLGMFGSDYAWILQGSPKDVPWWSDAANTVCSPAALMAAVEGLLLVSSHNSLAGPEPSLSGLTNAMFEEQFRKQNLPITRYTPQTYDAVWAIAMTLHHTETQRRAKGHTSISNFDYSDSHMAHEFLREMARLEFLGVSGPVSFSGADRVGISAFYQVQGGEVKKVALFYPASERLDFACPQCEPLRWQGGQVPIAKRVFRHRVITIERTAFYSVACLAGAGICLATVFLGFNLYFRKLKYIKLSSPRLNNIAVVGCILVYTAVILLGLDHATLPAGGAHFANVCTARAYLLSAGFSLAFGSMFTKTYRVHRIFTRSRSGVVKNKLLQDTQLISLICALLLVDILIVTLWVTVDPMQRHLRNLSLEISAIDRSVVYQPQVEVCRSQHTSGWLGALYVYKGLLLIVGVYMAWETRRVKIPALNDSQYIGMSVYSVVITSGIVVVLANLISERATLAFVTITALILASTSTTLCLLFVPKIHTIWLHQDGDPIVESMGLKIECNTRRFVIDERRERYYRVEVQNKVYRRELVALDSEINKLERMLIEPPPSPSSSGSVSHGSVSLPGSFRDDDGMSEGDEADEDSDMHWQRPAPAYNPRGAAALLLSVVPSVVPRASWPCAQEAERQQVTFRSEPELDQATEGSSNSAAALLKKLLPRIWKPSRAKANRSAIAAALRMHVNYVTESPATTAAPAFRERARGSPRFPHRIVPTGSGLLAPTARTGKCRSLDASMDAVACTRCGALQARNAATCSGCTRRDKPRAASLSPNCDVWCVEQSVACHGELTITIHRTDSQCS